MRPIAQYLHDRIIEAFIALDLTPRYIQFVTQVTTALSIAASGLGVALVPASAERLGFIGVEMIDVVDVEPNSIKTTAVWRRDSDNPTLHHFLRLLDVP